MKRVSILLLLLINTWLLFSEIIELKDGSVVTGKITNIDENAVTIVTSGRQRVIMRNEIENMDEIEGIYNEFSSNIPQYGNLKITVGEGEEIKIGGTGGFSKTIKMSQLLENLEPGEYNISLYSLESNDKIKDNIIIKANKTVSYNSEGKLTKETESVSNENTYSDPLSSIKPPPRNNLQIAGISLGISAAACLTTGGIGFIVDNVYFTFLYQYSRGYPGYTVYIYDNILFYTGLSLMSLGGVFLVASIPLGIVGRIKYNKRNKTDVSLFLRGGRGVGIGLLLQFNNPFTGEEKK